MLLITFIQVSVFDVMTDILGSASFKIMPEFAFDGTCRILSNLWIIGLLSLLEKTCDDEISPCMTS